MKRTIILVLAALFAIGMTACRTSEKGISSSSTPQETVASSQVSETPEPNASDRNQSEPDVSSEGLEPLVVMDVPMYRGTVTGFDDGGTQDHVIATLEQYKGSNYGAPTLRVVIDANTKFSPTRDKFAKDAYVEVYYAANAVDDVHTAIGVNYLSESAGMRNINGEIISIEPNQDGAGQIHVMDIDRNSEHIINYDDNTHIYLNMDELASGDKINVFYSGISTRSLPPQSPAMEIRKYAE